MNGLHLFIDNSNIFIEAQRVARAEQYYDDSMIIRLRVNYVNLMEVVRKERKLADVQLVGSIPPPNDALWKKLEALGIEITKFTRSTFTGREKRVDAELSNLIRDAMDDCPQPGTIALVAGDSDYMPTLERCIKKKWEVEVYFWDQASADLKTTDGIRFYSLNPFFSEITYLEKQRS